jgi:hypothetical protein
LYLSNTVTARLRNLGLVFDFDDVDITDKSKVDTFTKVFAILQCGALVIQSIARLASGLSITELELMTMAFVLSAQFTYILWWDKPFDVQRSHVLDGLTVQLEHSDGIQTIISTPFIV